MAAFVKFLLLGKILVLFFTTEDQQIQQNESPFTYKRISSFTCKSRPVIVYKNSKPGAEIIYKIILYSDPALKSPQQTLLVRKADENIKMLVGANYILSEVNSNSPYINYPYAWESANVDLKDLKEDCVNVFEKNTPPLKTN